MVKQVNITTRSKTLPEKNTVEAVSDITVEVSKNSPTKSTTPLKEINNSRVNSSNISTVFPRTITVPCTTMSLVLSNAKTSVVTVAQSGLLASPIMATGIQPVLNRSVGLSSLGPGTLIMSDGRVVTVPPVLTAAPQIIVNRPQSQPAVIVMQNIAAVKPMQHAAPQMRPIVPKPKPESTKTTYVNKVPISAIRVGRVNSAVVRSRNRKDTNKKVVCGKTETIKKTVSKATLGELVKENQPETEKHRNQTMTKQKVATNKSKLITIKKSLPNTISTNKKTQSVVNSNLAKRKCFEIDKNVELVKRKKVDDKVVGVVNVSKVVATTQSSTVDSCFELSNNKNSTSQTLAPSQTTAETNQNTCAKITTNLEPTTSTSEKENLVNSENKNVCSKEKTENLHKSSSNINKDTFEINTKRLVPINVVAEFNKDVNQPTEQALQSPSDVTVISIVYDQPTPRTIEDKNTINNNTTETVIDSNNINKALVTNNKATCVVGNTNIQEASSGTENITNDNVDKTLANDCPESNNDFNKDSSKRLVTQSCKATQITAEQLKYVQENTDISFVGKTEKPVITNKTDDVLKKSSPEKTTIPDVGQDLTSLFPIDPKLQVCPDNIFRDTDFRDRNLFMPISHSYMDEVRLSLPHSDFSNDLFSSLQVPTGGQHPESISPTAAFLMAFPLVSTSKTSEMIAENETGESQHATPTTILQIGNIDPPSDLYQQTALMIENNVSDLHDPMKLNKSPGSSKNNTKQMKRVEPFQQIQMNDLLHANNIPRNNCKEKKTFPALQEHNMYLPCNKKKSNERTCDYPLPNEIINHYQEKPYEFPPTNSSQHGIQNLPHNRQVGVSNNQKKTQTRPDNIIDHHNPCPASSQPYSYNAFPSGSDFSFPSSSYIPTNQTVHQMPKPPQTLSNFPSSWSTSSITTTSNCVDYTSPYCSYPQKPYTNTQNNKSAPQKLHHNNYDDMRIKEKTPSINSLPKFSTNFQFNSSNQPNVNTHMYPNTNQTDNGNYKIDTKTKKQKISNDSQRPPVNWMTTPDVRTVLPDSTIPPVLPDVMFPPQKELEFNSSTNNIMFSTSNNITPFNISSTVANNSQTFYPNSHFSGIDFQLDFAPFPEITSTKPSKTINTTSSNQFTWSPNKTSISLLPHIDSHMIPSTLPTLVGDLALGTTTPSGPIDTFRNLNMPTTPFIMDNPNKKFDSKSGPQKSVNKSPEKDCFSNTERRNSNKNITEYCQKTHSHQSTNTTSSFLSVSQLVDPVKSEQATSRRTMKQSVVSATKNSTSVQKRNISHQTEKINHSKSSTNISSINHSNNYHLNLPNPVMSNQNQRKPDTFHNNQTNSGYPNMFANNLNPAPWHNSKPNRTSNFKGGSYSAESLIGEPQNPVPELPPFSVANQYSNGQKAFMDASIVSSAAYSGADFSHQNAQPLDFQATQHTNQNCFNFPTHNTHYSEDYHNIGLDSLYSMNHPPSKTLQIDNKTAHKRNLPKRREEIAGSQQMQYFPRDATSSRGIKCPSPSHHGTSSVTNFNLSTIFPEINDKVSNTKEM